MICLNSAGDLARSEVQKKNRKKERKLFVFYSRSLTLRLPPRPDRPAASKIGPKTDSGATKSRRNPSPPAGSAAEKDGEGGPFLQGTSRRDGGATTSERAPREAGRADQNETERSDGRAPGEAGSAICVQRLDDSLNSAIHTRYRSLLRSSSMHEPRGPPLEVVNDYFTRHKLDAKRTTTSQPKKKIEGARWRQRGSTALALLTGRARHASARRGTDDRREPPPVPSSRNPERGGQNGARGSRKKTKSKTLMILPQVHLRKPCYDFYFL